MVNSSKHIDWQKYSERFALNILTDELKIPRENILESESPDFIFNYEGKQIGAEVVEYHRNPKETEARKAYQKSIDKYKGKKGKLTTVTVFDEIVTTFNGKKSEKQLSDALTDEFKYKFQILNLEDFVDAIIEEFPNQTVFKDFKHRYLDFQIAEYFLKQINN